MLAEAVVVALEEVTEVEDLEVVVMEELMDNLVQVIEVQAEAEDFTHQIITAAMADQVSLL
jgi:hypothetical protein